MKVLLAVDGSIHSLQAEKFLSTFPFAAPPELVLLNVCPVADLHVMGPEVPDTIQGMVDQCRSEGQRLLDEVQERCEGWAARIHIHLADGRPGQEIIAAAEKEQVDLVVVGAHGRTAIQRFFLGSTSERVAKYADCSVLVVHGSEERVNVERILLADDGSATADLAVERFSALPLGSGRSITVLGVLEMFKGYGMEFSLEATEAWQNRSREISAALTEGAQRLESTGARVETLVHEAKNVAEDIIETARSTEADLIVVGSTGKSGWQRLLLGSVSNRVLHHAPCSVWIERPRE